MKPEIPLKGVTYKGTFVAPEETLVQRLRERAKIRSGIFSDKLIQFDVVGELLLEAANEIEAQAKTIGEMDDIIERLEAKVRSDSPEEWVDSWYDY